MAFEDTILISDLSQERRPTQTSNGTETNCILTPFRKLYRAPFPPGFSRFPGCKIVLLLVLLHRLHIYSSFNFIVSLTATRNDSNIYEDSTVTAQLFMSATKLLAPFSGIIADIYIPRAKMVSMCFAISFIGSSIQSIFHSIYELKLVPISSYLYYSIHAIALCLLTVGSSGVYALLVPVGVDQMEGASEMRLKSYFSWHYWSINIGAGLAAGRYFIYATHKNDILTLLASSYLSTVSVFLALVVLTVSLHFGLLQRNMPPGGTPLIQVLGVTTCAVSSRCSHRGERSYYPIGLFDYALTENKGRYSYEQVQDVKTFYKIIFVLICMTWYFGVDNLYNTIFPLQGAELSEAENNFGSTKVIFLTSCVTILLLLPLIEIFRNRLKCRFGFKKILNKITLGIVFSFAAILVALSLNLVTYFRSDFTPDITVIIPQTILIAVSECIAFVGTMEFVYAQSPYQMIGFIFGIFQSLIGVGSYFPTAMYYILQKISNCYDIKNCTSCLVHWPPCFRQEGVSLDFVYYAVYALLTLLYILFMFCLAICYKRRERQRIEVWPRTK